MKTTTITKVTQQDEVFSDLELQHRKYMLVMTDDMSNKYKRS